MGLIVGIVQHKFRLYADYYQFYIGDSQADETNADASASSFWSEWALENGLAVAPALLGVGTISYGYLDVVVDIVDEKPVYDFGAWDQIVEASLELSSGGIAIDGCLDYSPDQVKIQVAPGAYRVRVYYGGLDNELDSEKDYYKLVLWPQEYEESVVLKKYSRSTQSEVC